jgi:hypothetical protein
MVLNINTDALVIYTNKLERLGQSSLPTAIRGALNKAAFNVKQVTMLKTASDSFVNRQPNFFKANSRVEMAKGNDIRLMQATVGFVENKLRGGNNFSVQDLEEQESGGKITNRSFIPVNNARSGGSYSNLVKPSLRLSKIKNVVNSNTMSGRNPRQKFLKAAAKAGVGGFIIGNEQTKILYRVKSLKHGKIKLEALYDYVEKRSITVKATHFMEKASVISGSQIEDFYISEAKRQIDRLS